MCCDATVVAPLRRNGRPIPRAPRHDGAALDRARRRKERTYPEVGHNGTRLVVLGCEVGGRWNDEALDFVRRLGRLRAAQAPPLLRQSVAAAYARRWWCLLGVAVQDALASTKLGLSSGPLAGCADNGGPCDADVVALLLEQPAGLPDLRPEPARRGRRAGALLPRLRRRALQDAPAQAGRRGRQVRRAGAAGRAASATRASRLRCRGARGSCSAFCARTRAWVSRA